jgi:hypothetical protein
MRTASPPPPRPPEAGLHDVVRVHAIGLADVEGEAGVVGHGHEEHLHQLGVGAADLLGRDREPAAEVGPAGAIEGHLHQGLGEGLAHGDAYVLVAVVVVAVVVVAVGVARGADLQVEQAVASQLVEHVIQERHAGGHLAMAAAIEIALHPHLGFAGDAVDRAGAGGRAGGAVLHGVGRVVGEA